MAKPKPVDLNDEFISGGEKKHQEIGEKSGSSKKKKENNEKDKKIRMNFMLHESTRKKLFHYKAETGRSVSSVVDELVSKAL